LHVFLRLLLYLRRAWTPSRNGLLREPAPAVSSTGLTDVAISPVTIATFMILGNFLRYRNVFLLCC
jgi:hypothetical protein